MNAQTFQICRCHLKILDASRLAWSSTLKTHKYYMPPYKLQSPRICAHLIKNLYHQFLLHIMFHIHSVCNNKTIKLWFRTHGLLARGSCIFTSNWWEQVTCFQTHIPHFPHCNISGTKKVAVIRVTIVHSQWIQKFARTTVGCAVDHKYKTRNWYNITYCKDHMY